MVTTKPSDRPAPEAASASPPPRVPVSPAHHAWLTAELREWEREGLIAAPTADAIADRYVPSAQFDGRRLSPIKVLLGLGATFLGVGLIWLVASNLEQLSPLPRFVVVVAIWTGLAVVAEVTRGLVSGAFRLLTALAAGAVVFQAAQSLQVPAYRPHLLLAWGLGALMYAYARRSRAAAIVGIVVVSSWYLWQVMDSSANVVTFTVAMLLASVAAVGVAMLHPDSPDWRGFGRIWLTLAAAMSLIGMFAAALPYGGDHGGWTGALTAGIILALGILAAGAWRSTREEQYEAGIAVGALVLGTLIVLWRPGYDHNLMSNFTPAMWLRTGLAVGVFLALAGAWTVVGARRELPVVTAFALIGLVIFTTFQSFAVFAQILTGATLFLLVGTVMIVTGILAERARRRIGTEVQS